MGHKVHRETLDLCDIDAVHRDLWFPVFRTCLPFLLFPLAPRDCCVCLCLCVFFPVFVRECICVCVGGVCIGVCVCIGG